MANISSIKHTAGSILTKNESHNYKNAIYKEYQNYKQVL